MPYLYEHVNYRAPIDYMISSIVREYDIKSANISVLRKAGILSEEEYQYFSSMDKNKREVMIGLKLQKNPELNTVLKDGITEARRLFFLHNNIQDHEVLAIKNDAILLINKIATVTDIGQGVIFINKNEYTSYYMIKNKKFYYYLNQSTQEEVLDIEGMSKENVCKHEKYFVDFLLELFYSAQTLVIEDVLTLLRNFYNEYITLQLPIEYYRRFDGMSRYEFNDIAKFSDFSADFLYESYKPYLDISYNLSILMDLQKIFSGIYFQTRPFNSKH